MHELPRHFELRCPACSAGQTCGPPEVVDRLLQLGKLRRGRYPDEDVLYEVFRSLLPQMTCACGHQGLVAEPCPEDAADWPAVPSCRRCGQAIPLERLSAVPGAKYCAACQELEDREDEPEF